MRVASVSRSIVLGGWLLAALWQGTGWTVSVLLATALLAVWGAALLRDARRPALTVAALSRPAGATEAEHAGYGPGIAPGRTTASRTP